MLIPVIDRLRSRFGIRRVCIVADRGMIRQGTLAAPERPERGWQFILGARIRSQDEVRDEVLSRAGRYRVVHPGGADVRDLPGPGDSRSGGRVAGPLRRGDGVSPNP